MRARRQARPYRARADRTVPCWTCGFLAARRGRRQCVTCSRAQGLRFVPSRMRAAARAHALSRNALPRGSGHLHREWLQHRPSASHRLRPGHPGVSAGLRTCGRGPWAHLLGLASQVLRPSAVAPFVSAYRCGAVPDLHRIPFSAGPSGSTPRTPTGTRYGGGSIRSTQDVPVSVRAGAGTSRRASSCAGSDMPADVRHWRARIGVPPDAPAVHSAAASVRIGPSSTFGTCAWDCLISLPS